MIGALEFGHFTWVRGSDRPGTSLVGQAVSPASLRWTKAIVLPKVLVLPRQDFVRCMRSCG
jgi:hypothetical protein